ncbi:MAG: hypothetical protein IV090_00095 [Candidatus Sericytochromatia bacterium]|nr:hypothetical protein [Candidatus Sericytochromatia bacterium]
MKKGINQAMKKSPVFLSLFATSLLLFAGCENNAGKNIVVSPNIIVGGATSGSNSGSTSGSNSSNTSSVTASPAPSLPDSSAVKKQIEQVIHDNANAINTDDYDALFASLHPSSPINAEMQAARSAGFNNFGTRQEILSVDVTSVSEASSTAKVRRKVTNSLGTVTEEAIYTLKKNDQRWGIMTVAVTSQSAG